MKINVSCGLSKSNFLDFAEQSFEAELVFSKAQNFHDLAARFLGC